MPNFPYKLTEITYIFNECIAFFFIETPPKDIQTVFSFLKLLYLKCVSKVIPDIPSKFALAIAFSTKCGFIFPLAQANKQNTNIGPILDSLFPSCVNTINEQSQLALSSKHTQNVTISHYLHCSHMGLCHNHLLTG